MTRFTKIAAIVAAAAVPTSILAQESLDSDTCQALNDLGIPNVRCESNRLVLGIPGPYELSNCSRDEDCQEGQFCRLAVANHLLPYAVDKFLIVRRCVPDPTNPFVGEWEGEPTPLPQQ